MRPSSRLGPKTSPDVALCQAGAVPRNRRYIDPGSLGAYKASEPTHDPRSRNPSGSGAQSMKIRFWGTRGSVPTPGHRTARFGGNTSCVEVRADDGTCLVIDCGTGAR